MRESTTLAIFTLLSATLLHGLENPPGDGKPVIGGASQIPMNIPNQFTQSDADPVNPKPLELSNLQISIKDFININVKMPREQRMKMLETFAILRLYTKDPNVLFKIDALLSFIQIFRQPHHHSSNNPQQLQQPSNVVWGFPLPMIGGYPNNGLAGLPPAMGFPNSGLAGLSPFGNVNHLFAPGSNNDQMNAAAFGNSNNDHFNEDPKQDMFKPSNAADAPRTQDIAPELEAVNPTPPPPPPASTPEPVPAPAPATAPVNVPVSVEKSAPENTLSNMDRFRRMVGDMGNLTRAGINYGREQANVATAAAAKRFPFNPFMKGNAALDRVQGTGPDGPPRVAVQVQ